MGNNMFLNAFNVKEFVENGYHKTLVNEEFTKMLLSEIKTEHWVQVSKEYVEEGKKARREYRNRYISKRGLFSPRKLKDVYSELLSGVEVYLTPITSKYSLEGCGNTLTPFLGMPGYMMESHSDVGDRAVAIVMVYLSEEEFNENTGGELEIYGVDIDKEGKGINHKLKDTIYPNNGVVVVINCNDPRFEHAVKEVKNDNRRYSLFITVGTESINDWEYSFKEDKGKIDLDQIYPMGEPKDNE